MENQSTPPVQPPTTSALNVPAAILIAGVLVAGAILWTKNSPAPTVATNKATIPEVKISPVTEADHILGNPAAPIKIVEYSDPSCPFCKVFHPTMKKIMDIYGKSSKVAWVYRQFPLVQIHPNAHRESEALECANEIGGNDKFWAYTNRLYEITPSTSGKSLDPAELPNIAKYVGIDTAKFNECLSSGRHVAKVDAQLNEGANAGVSGTPFSIIVLENAVSAVDKEKILKNFEQYRDSRTGQLPVKFINNDKSMTINGALPEASMMATLQILVSLVK